MSVAHPDPPIGLDDPTDAPEHLAGDRVALDDAFLDALGRACGTVDSDAASIAESGRDWWPLALGWSVAGEVPARPGAVARPTSVAEVREVARLCDEAGIPLVPAGGRSGVCGGTIPVFGGVMLDLRGLSGIIGVDDGAMLVDVGAGTFGPELESELRGTHGLTVGHWPQSIDLATVGGWIACRGAGQYSTRYGKIEDIVAGLEVVLADGRVIHTGAMAGAGPRSAMGPDLTQLFVGSEGTLGIVTAARLRAHPAPPAELRSAWSFATFAGGLDALRTTLRRGATPAVLRLYDETESSRNFQVEGANLLVALDEGDESVIGTAMDVLAAECTAAGARRLDDELVARWLEHRNDVSALEGVTRAGITVDTIEISAPWSSLPAIYQSATTGLRELEGCLAASAHESHAYADGACLYFTFAGRPPGGPDPSFAEHFYRSAWETVLRATSEGGGSISHHHGIGLVRGRYLRGALGDGFAVLESLKDSLDPNGILNPGKLGLRSPFGPTPWPGESA